MQMHLNAHLNVEHLNAHSYASIHFFMHLLLNVYLAFAFECDPQTFGLSNAQPNVQSNTCVIL